MDLVSLERAGVGVNARELDVLAEVVPAVQAQEAVPARDTRLDGNSVT